MPTISLRPLNITIVIGLLYLIYLFSPLTITTPFSSSSFNTMPSPSGFLDRSTPLSSSTLLTRESLTLAVLRNAPVETAGFTLALFAPNVAVTHFGSIYQLQEGDYNAILDLASQTSTLPTSERFYNTWAIDQPRTSQPIDRVLVPLSPLEKEPKQSYKDEYREISVQGYEAGKTKLMEDIAGYTELPGILERLVGAVLEARKGDWEVDESVVGRVKAVLGNVY